MSNRPPPMRISLTSLQSVSHPLSSPSSATSTTDHADHRRHSHTKSANHTFTIAQRPTQNVGNIGGGGVATQNHSKATKAVRTSSTIISPSPKQSHSVLTVNTTDSHMTPPDIPRLVLSPNPETKVPKSPANTPNRKTPTSSRTSYIHLSKPINNNHTQTTSSTTSTTTTTQPQTAHHTQSYQTTADNTPDSSRKNSHVYATNSANSTAQNSKRPSQQNFSAHTITPTPYISSSTRSSTSSSSSSHLADVSADEFDQVDDAVSRSSTFSSLFHIVRLCSSQTSHEAFVTTLERTVQNLLGASSVRLFTVQNDGLYRDATQTLYPLQCGIIGHFAHSKQIKPLHMMYPDKNDRYNAALDGASKTAPPHSLLLVNLFGEDDDDDDTETTSTTNTSSSQQQTQPISRRNAIAVLCCAHDADRHDFTPRHCRILTRLAELIGANVSNTRSVERANALYNASKQNERRSTALLDVAKALASETDLPRIVSIIVSQVPELLDSDRCTLFFVDRDRQQLVVTKGASHGRRSRLSGLAPELPFPKGQNEIRFPMHMGIAGHVAMTGETVNVEDAHEDKRFDSSMDAETGYRTRSLLCVPMIDANGDIIGVVQSINKNALYAGFDKADQVLLKTFSAQAALAVRNSQLFQRTALALRHADALLEVTRALSSELKIEALIAIICNKVQSLLNSQRCTVFIVDRERKELYTTESMSYGMGPALPIDREKQTLISFPMDRGIAGAVATTGATVNIADAYKDSRFNQAMDKSTGFRTQSILCMAITNHRGEIAGVLQVMNKDNRGVFDDEDSRLLSAFCAQAAVAIENSRLFQQTEKALNHALADQRNLKFMLSVTKNLFSDMHLTSMIDQMTMQVHHLLKADDCALYLVDAEKQEIWLAKEEENKDGNHGNNHKAAVTKWPFNTGIAGVVAATAQVIRISTHAHLDSRFNPIIDQRKGKTTHSILCCPIKAELSPDVSRVVGVISVRDEKDRGGFEVEEEKLLKVFCAQAAVAIMNSKRFSQIMEQSSVNESDHSAAEYLKENRGMKLASDDINSFQYTMDEIVMKGAIGTGSYGEVYKAMVRGQIVAVKKLHVRNLRAEQVDSFCKEASLMCQLDHPNIVGFIGAVTEPSNLCILTQFCARGSLADLLLDESNPMTFALKCQFALDAARGMCYLHNSNPVILHRDLKSDNLLVSNDWTIKVADFGLTRFISEKKQMTQVGTPMWMAPEIIMGKKYTEKADVYAFGIILWEILTRLEPYEDKEPMQIVVEVVNEGLRPAIPVDCLDNPLVPLMRDCWHSEPSQRPTFEKIAERLKVIHQNSVEIESAQNVLSPGDHDHDDEESQSMDNLRSDNLKAINGTTAVGNAGEEIPMFTHVPLPASSKHAQSL